MGLKKKHCCLAVTLTLTPWGMIFFPRFSWTATSHVQPPWNSDDLMNYVLVSNHRKNTFIDC